MQTWLLSSFTFVLKVTVPLENIHVIEFAQHYPRGGNKVRKSYC